MIHKYVQFLKFCNFFLSTRKDEFKDRLCYMYPPTSPVIPLFVWYDSGVVSFFCFSLFFPKLEVRECKKKEFKETHPANTER